MYSMYVYRDIDGVLRRANATEFGLASGVFTKDINKVWDIYSATGLKSGFFVFWAL